MRLALAIASFVALIVHGIVFYDQFFHTWERYQNGYFDQAGALAKTPAEKSALAVRAPRIEQILVTRFGDTRVDRCSTCHIAVDDPRFKDHAQPMQTHPYSRALGDVFVNGKWERRHKFSDFGCTVCHDGQGRGLKQVYSHGEDPFWPEPLLGYVAQEDWRKEYASKLKGREFMEANCAQCHTEEAFPNTPEVSKGRALFFSRNCYGCHRLEGLSEGALGPDLTEAGRKFKLDYLWESIAKPRANLATSFMPEFHLTDSEIKALVIFLKSRRGMNFSETSLQRYRAELDAKREGAGSQPEVKVQPAALVDRGAKALNDRACVACHKLGDADGGIAPDLSFEGLLKEAGWLQSHFDNPRASISDSIMPSFRFASGEFEAMSAYLASLNKVPTLGTPAQTYGALCARCHGEKGDGHGRIAIYLDPYPRDFTKAGFMNSKPLDRFSNSIRDGVAGTSMPAWGKVLKGDQVQGLLQYVLTNFTKEPRRDLKPRQVPQTNPVALSPASIARGEQTFVKRCGGCHGRKGDGKGPNSIDILPRPRNLRNSAFVNSVADHRLLESILYGVQGTAMPPWIDYGLSAQDAGDVVNFIRSLNSKPDQKPVAGIHQESKHAVN